MTQSGAGETSPHGDQPVRRVNVLITRKPTIITLTVLAVVALIGFLVLVELQKLKQPGMGEPDSTDEVQISALVDSITAPPRDSRIEPGTPAMNSTSPLAAPPAMPVAQPADSVIKITARTANLEKALKVLQSKYELVVSESQRANSGFQEQIRAIEAEFSAQRDNVSTLKTDIETLRGELTALRASHIKQHKEQQRVIEDRRHVAVERPHWVRSWGGVEMAGFPSGAFSVGDQVGEWKISDIDVGQQRVTLVALRPPHRELSLTPTSTDQ